MKINLLCIECVLIFTLFRFYILAEDAPTTPSIPSTIPTSENISSDNELQTEKSDNVRDLEPSVDVLSSFNEKNNEDGEDFKPVFIETTSQNSGVANEISTNGQQVVVTLTDAATSELQQRAILPSQKTEDSQIKQNETIQKIPKNLTETNETRSDKIDIPSVKENLTTEEIPSFSEWAQKQLEEEKNKESTNSSNQHQVNGKQAKLRWKNYASLDCGAKVVASNPEAVSPSAILSPSRDEYKLNTCTSRIWFIVELCEAIQAKKIDLANFELFSSSPKDFVVSVSDRFPTRDWSNVGNFQAKDERDIQSFDLNPHLFAKYIKVEVKSHYGSEHYCPISLFRVFGTSEFEVLQKEDSEHREDDDDDDETLDTINGDASKNLFSSATDAVISMVKKAAEVLGNKGNHSNQTEPTNRTKQIVPLVRVCTCPSHLVVCDNCSDALFGQVYELLSCDDKKIFSLVKNPLIRKVITETDICKSFGLDFKLTESVNLPRNYIKVLFPERFLGAMCNMIAILQNKVVLNVSQTFTNNTKPPDDDAIIKIETSEPHSITPEPITKQPEVTDALNLEFTETVSKSTCSTDVTYASQIKPTKTLTPDLNLKESSTEPNYSTSGDGGEVISGSETVRANTTIEVEVEEKLEDSGSDEVLEDPLDPLLEFNGGEGQHNTQTPTSATPQVQKESVFLRLSNRIKALERNMSLSGQYLEELSKRYKKQVEEIQKLLDKTILSINEESKKKDERNKQLEERLASLTASVEALLAERRSWSSTVYCIIVSSLVTLFIVTFCARIPDPIVTKRPEINRRKSIDIVTQPPQQKKKRRPSDQALKIVRSSMETSENLRKKKKKKQVLKRSNSISTLSEEKVTVWTRQESAPAEAPTDWVEGKHLEDVPFVLEESEHSSLEPLALAEKITPNYVKTALSSRAVRVNGEVTRKSASVDETIRKHPINGNLSLTDSGTFKEKRKGFKKIFKKVF